MKAFFIERPGVTGIREVPRPTPAVGEALLRLRYVGFCGSDLNSYRGRSPMVSFPRIPGHEVAATLESPPPELARCVASGDRVTVMPYTACGKCSSCRRGRANACQFNQTLGVQRDGAMTEYIVVPWQKVVPAPGLSFRDLCMVEPLAVGFHAVGLARIGPSDTVAVFGCGAVGLGAVSAAAFRGARTIAIDLDDDKLRLAARAGATFTVNSASENLHTRLVELTGGGPDVVVEAIGLPATFRAAVEEVAFTGRVVYVGYSKETVSYDTRLFVQKELEILGSRNATLADFHAVITMLRQGKFPVDKVVTVTVPFEQAGTILRSWDQNPTAFTKVLVGVGD